MAVGAGDGPGVAVAVGAGDGLAVAVAVGAGDGLAVALAVGAGDGLAVAVAVDAGDGLAVALAVDAGDGLAVALAVDAGLAVGVVVEESSPSHARPSAITPTRAAMATFRTASPPETQCSVALRRPRSPLARQSSPTTPMTWAHCPCPTTSPSSRTVQRPTGSSAGQLALERSAT